MPDAPTAEEIVAAAWARVLLVDDIDPSRGFLSQGGSSLATLQVASQIGDALELSGPALDQVLMALIADQPADQVAQVARGVAPRPT